MTGQPHRKTGHKKRRGREAKRLARDRKIFGKLRLMVAAAEHRHAQFDEAIEPLSVYYGKEYTMGKRPNQHLGNYLLFQWENRRTGEPCPNGMICLNG